MTGLVQTYQSTNVERSSAGELGRKRKEEEWITNRSVSPLCLNDSKDDAPHKDSPDPDSVNPSESEECVEPRAVLFAW